MIYKQQNLSEGTLYIVSRLYLPNFLLHNTIAKRMATDMVGGLRQLVAAFMLSFPLLLNHFRRKFPKQMFDSLSDAERMGIFKN